jgi:dihydroneopterin triphosphate diphosphatase
MPELRTNMVSVDIARRGVLGLEFLQLRRSKDPLRGTWQPVMGGIEPGETALEAGLRELQEEVGLDRNTPHVLAMYALDEVFPFYVVRLDAVFLCPRLLAEVDPSWKPALNHEHDDHRWVQEHKASEMFLWPGQRRGIDEASRLLRGDPSAQYLKLD